MITLCWREYGEIGTLIYCWSSVNWYHCFFGGQFGNNFQNINIHISLESAIPFLGLYPIDILAHVYKDLGKIIFIAILFVIA